MTDEVIGGPCIYGCGDVPGHPGVCLVTRLKPEEHPTEDALKVRVERLEHRVSDLSAYVQAAEKETCKLNCPNSIDPQANGYCHHHRYYLRGLRGSR